MASELTITMRKTIFLLCWLTLAGSIHAQTRYQGGAFGTGAFNNYQAGVFGSVDIPIGRRFEVGLSDGYSFAEIKPGVGKGTANVARVTGTAWFTPKIGVSAFGEQSGYTLGTLSKGAIYVGGGPVFRLYMLGFPARLTLGYLAQLNNGIVGGIETSYMRAALISVQTRLGCTGQVCFHLTHEFAMGSVLSQGNPQCDGTFGNGSQAKPPMDPCSRPRTIGGGFQMRFGAVFPRHKDTEDDPF